MRQRIAVLGCTGSIGSQTLEVVRDRPDQFEVVSLAAHSDEVGLLAACAEFGVSRFSLFSRELPGSVGSGEDGLARLAVLPEVDAVVMAVPGAVGLRPSIAALEAGKRLALASKEVLVMAGETVMALAGKNGSSLTPIDSEHSAVFQCLQGVPRHLLDKIIITASGGPFRGHSKEFLAKVTLEQALNHPTWKMGGKITIDSATLMNKALEVIEARWLFDLKPEQIDTVIHPQSVVHSMVKTVDGSVLGQLGWPSMKLPILYALTYPERIANGLKPWNPVDTPTLTFEPVDHETFPSIKMAYDALRKGGTAAAAMNAANEAIVASYLTGGLRFLDIFEGVQEVASSLPIMNSSLENLVHVDLEARRLAREWAASRSQLNA